MTEQETNGQRYCKAALWRREVEVHPAKKTGANTLVLFTDEFRKSEAEAALAYLVAGVITIVAALAAA